MTDGIKQFRMYLLFFILVVANIEASKILLFFPPTRSQLLSATRMATILSDDGHKVTIVIPTNDEPDIKKSSKYDILYYKTSMSREEELIINKEIANVTPKDILFGQVPPTISKMLGGRCNSLLFDQELQMKMLDLKPELAIVHAAMACIIPYLNRISVPFLDFCPITLMHATCGEPHRIPAPTSYVPDGFLSDVHTSFLSRVANTIVFLVAPKMVPILMYKDALEMVSQYQTKYGLAHEDLSELRSKASFLLVHGDITFEPIRPLIPKVVYVGGVQCDDPKSLEGDFENFVSGSGDAGIIVFSMGGVHDTVSERFLKIFLDIFRELPHHIVWRLKNVPLHLKDQVPPNVKFVDWLPQQDLLGHPKTKLFITHGGIQGSFESICHGKPSLGIDFNMDQIQNIKILVKKGMALHVNDFRSVDPNDAKDKIHKLLTDPVYLENAIKAQTLFKDQPLTAAQRLLFAVNYTIRHKGAYHLTSDAALKLNWFQYYLLDVYIFLFIVFLMILFVTVFVSKLCLKCFISLCKGNRKVKNE